MRLRCVCMLTDTRATRGAFALLYRVVALVPRASRSTHLSTRAGLATTVSNVYRVGLKSHDPSGNCRGTVVHGMLGSRVDSTTAYVLCTVPAQAALRHCASYNMSMERLVTAWPSNPSELVASRRRSPLTHCSRSLCQVASS